MTEKRTRASIRRKSGESPLDKLDPQVRAEVDKTLAKVGKPKRKPRATPASRKPKATKWTDDMKAAAMPEGQFTQEDIERRRELNKGERVARLTKKDRLLLKHIDGMLEGLNTRASYKLLLGRVDMLNEKCNRILDTLDTSPTDLHLKGIARELKALNAEVNTPPSPAVKPDDPAPGDPTREIVIGLFAAVFGAAIAMAGFMALTL